MKLQLSKKVSNAIYGYGAAIVIIGALMKITYFSPTWWPSAANTMLTIGLVIEALIFAYSAIDPSLAKDDYEWERVYPQLKSGKPKKGDEKTPHSLMSENIEEMFRKYKLDENGKSIPENEQKIENVDAVFLIAWGNIDTIMHYPNRDGYDFPSEFDTDIGFK